MYNKDDSYKTVIRLILLIISYR